MTSISASVLDRADEYAQQFRLAEPFQFVVIDDFLEPSFARQLQADFPAFEDRHALNEMGQVGGKAVRMDVCDISEAYRQLDSNLNTPKFLDFMSQVTGISDLLFDPDYVGGGTHENRHGQSLDAHVDFNYHPRTRCHRRLNLIIYLNEQWDPSWGGELELHSDPWDATRNRTLNVSPLMNKAVIFETTEDSWHGFSSIDLPEESRDLSRRSFAIYLYTRERPAQQTAPPHATIYVPEMMPVDWREGRSLSPGDLRELRNRFARLRSQLRYLYDREKHFGAQIAEMEAALVDLRNSQRVELQGYATQPHGATGLSSDGWVTEELVAQFDLTQKARKLTMEVWVPPQMEGEQELSIELNGKRFTQQVCKGTRTPVTLTFKGSAGDRIVLRVRAARVWVPATAGDSGDQRRLAYKLLSTCIE